MGTASKKIHLYCVKAVHYNITWPGNYQQRPKKEEGGHRKPKYFARTKYSGENWPSWLKPAVPKWGGFWFCDSHKLWWNCSVFLLFMHVTNKKKKRERNPIFEFLNTNFADASEVLEIYIVHAPRQNFNKVAPELYFAYMCAKVKFQDIAIIWTQQEVCHLTCNSAAISAISRHYMLTSSF